MGRPDISIEFKKLAQSAVERSANGIVALIIKDDTDTSFNTVSYTPTDNVDEAKFTSDNKEYILDVLKGGVAKVIVSRVDVVAVTPIVTAIVNIGNQYYNWIGIADGQTDEQTKLVELIKANPKVSAVVFNNEADHERIVNFANAQVTPKGKALTDGNKYIPRLVGLIGGCPMTKSTTYRILEDLESVVEPDDVDIDVDNGKFVLFNDEGVVRVARGVNSLITLGDTKYEDMKKITIMDTLTMIRRDVFNMFKEHYVGEFKNSYDNQLIFFISVEGYFQQLSFEGVLDTDSPNVVSVNVPRQRLELMKTKPEASAWSEKQVKDNSIGSMVFPKTTIRVNDAMEDLDFEIFN